MSNKNQLSEESLEKVTGGEESSNQQSVLYIKYKETEDGKVLSYEYGKVDSLQAKALAEEWCSLNNKIYVDYTLMKGATNSFDTQVLLDSISLRNGN